MKNILIILLVAFCWAACNDEENVAPVIPGVTITGDDLLPGDSLMYDTTARTSTLALTVSGEWNAVLEEEVEWCGVIRSALPGINKLQINVFSNQDPDERTCHVLVTGGGEQRRLTVYQIGSTPTLKVAPNAFTSLTEDSTVIKFRVITNVSYKVNVQEGSEWILPLPQEGLDTISYRFAIRKNGTSTRSGKILVKQVDGELQHEIVVFQQARESDYTPGNATNIGDRKIEVESATATGTNSDGTEIPDFWYGQATIDLSYDGKVGTHYASNGAGKLPVKLTYNFSSPSNVDYLTYLPRQDGNASSGFIGECTVWYQVDGNSEFVKAGDYNFGQTSSLYRLTFDTPLQNVAAIRVEVTSSNNTQVSCAEMEFYEKRYSAAADLFTDETCSELKPDVTMDDINNLDENMDGFLKKIARFIYEDNYPMERVQVYQPYFTLSSLSERLKVATYNLFENPTGIYFTAGERVVIFVQETTAPISLKIVDWSEEGEEAGKDILYSLTSGTNVITPSNNGLGYISYYTEDYETAPEVKIHIASGIVNGYFDLERGDQDSKYTTLLNNEKSKACPNLDIRGKYVQLCYDKKSLLSGNANRAVEMIQEYDNLIKMEQDIMGIDKYRLRTNNRMFARRSYSGLPNANGYGVSFPSVNVKPENIRNNSWEIAHEFGHVNQVRPGMKWTGLDEVSNNIYSAAVQYHYTPDNLRLEGEKIGDGEGGPAVVGNRFNCYLNNGIVKGQCWLFQLGQERDPDNATESRDGGDLFVRLVPLWQLYLYNEIAGLGVEDFYPKIMNIVRNTDETGLSASELQLNFMRNTCQVMNANMTKFFKTCGMLKEVDRNISGYGGSERLTITSEDIAAFEQEMEDLPEPESPVIYYISGYTVNSFKNKIDVVGTTGEGVSGSGTSRLVEASKWKNVVMFETYAGDELLKLTLPYTNFADKTATTVYYPDGSTRIEAVGWDGKRTLVYGTR